jgi:hypothetical protein
MKITEPVSSFPHNSDPERRHEGETAMGVLDSVGGFIKDAGHSLANVAESGVKAASNAFDTAVEDAKAAAHAVGNVVREVDAAKEKVGAWIDQKEQQLEHKVDDGRAWLREHGGVAGQVVSDQIGLVEGVGTSLYGAGKGIVQLADGVSSLTNPLEWAANPDANIARLKSGAQTVETLGKIANLAQPTSWITDPKGNAQLAGALWHEASTSFNKDPAKFIGNAVGTVGTFFIPGGGEAAVAGDVGRAAVVVNDVGKVADVAKLADVADVAKVATTADAANAARLGGLAEDAGTATRVAARAGGDVAANAIARGGGTNPGSLLTGSRLLPGEALDEAVMANRAAWRELTAGNPSASRIFQAGEDLSGVNELAIIDHGAARDVAAISAGQAGAETVALSGVGRVGPNALAEMLVQSGWQGGQLRLVACSTGLGSTQGITFGEQLSIALAERGAPTVVAAPRGLVMVGSELFQTSAPVVVSPRVGIGVGAFQYFGP